MKLFTVLICAIGVSACEQTFNLPSPTAPGDINITSNNTNNNTNTIDKTGSDTGPTPNQSNPDVSVIPLPAYGESVLRSVAQSNSTLLANSCQTKYGESAWAFLDLAIRSLRARDDRWGYLCKDESCSKKSADIVAYRASSGDTGIWIVDVIGNHCPDPSDTVTATWQVLPFETIRKWSATR